MAKVAASTVRIRGASFRCLTNRKEPISVFLQKDFLPEEKFNQLLQEAKNIADKYLSEYPIRDIVRNEYANCVGRNADTRLSFQKIPADYAEKLEQLDNSVLKVFVILVAQLVTGEQIFKPLFSSESTSTTKKANKKKSVTKQINTRKSVADKKAKEAKEANKTSKASTKKESNKLLAEVTDKKEYVAALKETIESEMQYMPQQLRNDYQMIRSLILDSSFKSYNISKFANPNAMFTVAEKIKILNYILGKLFVDSDKYKKLCLKARSQLYECLILNPELKDWVLIVHYKDNRPYDIVAKYLGKPLNYLSADIMTYGVNELAKLLQELLDKLEPLF